MGASKGSQDSRQVLHQAHSLSAVIERILVGGEEDTVTFEEELNAHSHMVCRMQVGTGSGVAEGTAKAGLCWAHRIQYGYPSL